jgi:hypothetical protein
VGGTSQLRPVLSLCDLANLVGLPIVYVHVSLLPG